MCNPASITPTGLLCAFVYKQMKTAKIILKNSRYAAGKNTRKRKPCGEGQRLTSDERRTTWNLIREQTQLLLSRTLVSNWLTNSANNLEYLYKQKEVCCSYMEAWLDRLNRSRRSCGNAKGKVLDEEVEGINISYNNIYKNVFYVCF